MRSLGFRNESPTNKTSKFKDKEASMSSMNEDLKISGVKFSNNDLKQEQDHKETESPAKKIKHLRTVIPSAKF